MNLLIISDGDSKYGSANSLLGLVSNLKNNHSDLNITIVLTMYSEMLNNYQRIGCRVVKLPYSFYYRTFSYELWKRPFSYIKHLPEYYYGRITALGILKKNVNIDEFDIIHTNTQREDLSLEIAKKYKKPLVMHIREFGDLDYKSFSYRRSYIALMNKYVSRYVVISDIVKEHWIAKGLEPSKITRIYNGVDINSDYKRDYYFESDKCVKFVIMGAILENKCHHVLIKALSEINEDIRNVISVDIIGESTNSYGKKIKRLVDDLGLSSIVTFKGYIKSPSRFLKNYDCGIMCSRSEAFGRVTAEYMMAGLCVIAADSGANSEIITDHVNGLLFKEGNELELAKCIKTIVNNRHIIKEYGINARNEAHSRFTTHKNAENIYNLYKKIISEN